MSKVYTTKELQTHEIMSNTRDLNNYANTQVTLESIIETHEITPPYNILTRSVKLHQTHMLP